MSAAIWCMRKVALDNQFIDLDEVQREFREAGFEQQNKAFWDEVIARSIGAGLIHPSEIVKGEYESDLFSTFMNRPRRDDAKPGRS